jgi:hypothetical protein
MQMVQEGEMSIASFFQDNDKDDRFTHANPNTIDFSDYPITDSNHYVFRNIEKIWLQERTPEVKSDQCLLAHGFR